MFTVVLGAGSSVGAGAVASRTVEVERPVLVAALHRVGLTPESLAASGATAEAAAAVVRRAAEHLGEAAWALDSADQLCRERETEVWRLDRLRKTGRASAGDIEALATARGLAAEAQAARAQVLDSVFSAAVDGMGSERVGVLQNVRINMGSNMEPELSVVQRTTEEWTRLGEAAAVCRAHEDGAAPQRTAALLAEARADAAVVTARQNLAALPEVREAWLAAVNGR